MANIKNFSLVGIGNNIQLGKRGGYLNYNALLPDNNNSTTPGIQLFKPDGSTLSRLQVANPLTQNDAATKYYVDSVVQGLNLKEAVYVATTPVSYESDGTTVIEGSGNIPLSGSLNSTNQLIIDGKNVPNGSRVLIKDQTDKKENGIYVITINISDKTYTLTRSDDANNTDSEGNTTSELSSGTFVFVQTGVLNADTGWVLSFPVGNVAIGTDNIEWVQFSSAGVISAGDGILKDGTVLSINSDGTTIYTNTTGQVSVKSSDDGLVLVSKAGNQSATWGQVDLTKGVTNILPTVNGGTGISSYKSGDILIGSATETTSTLQSLSIGKINQYLNVSQDTNKNLNVEWNYVSNLYTTDGILAVKSSSLATNTSYLSVSGSDKNSGSGYDTNDNILQGLSLSVTDSTTTDVNLSLIPSGNGIILGRSGYSSYIQSNYSRPTDGTTNKTPLIPDDTIATVGFVMDKIVIPDTTKIYNTDSSGKITAAVETNKEGYTGDVVISSNNKILSQITSVDPVNGDTAVNGEKLLISAIPNEVRLYSTDNTSTDSVNLRLIPQAGGYVYLGEKGSGIIKSEDTYSLTLSAGDGNTSTGGGDAILKGGDSKSSTTNGGNVIIQGGAPTTTSGSTSIGGNTFIKDSSGNSIIEFISDSINAVNYFYMQNSADNTEQGLSGLHFGVSSNSKTTDVSVYIDTLGKGLLRANDGDSYTTNLSQSGNDNAFVTKKYVDSTVGGATIPDGHGLTTYTDSNTTYRTINFGNSNTIGFDASYNIVVKSGATDGLILVSKTGAGSVTEATWTKIDLSSQNSITNSLGVSNGGTGMSTYNIGDILYANSTTTLSALSSSTSSENSSLVLKKDTNGNIVPTYSFISNIYDTNGNVIITGLGSTTPVNSISITNADSGINPTLSIIKGASETDYVGFNIFTAKNGLIYTNSTYTSALSDTTNTNSNNALVTKQYVDSSIASGGDPLLVKQNISSNYGQSMNIGSPKAAITNKQIVVSEVLIDVQTVFSGGDIDGIAIYSGNNTSGIKLMDISDSDILSLGTYIKELDSSIDISGSQITCYFYKIDGSTLTIPTAGVLNVIVKYNIIGS